jgi:uncharacterized protein DUF955
VRRQFTFYHELMHHRIEHDDEMLSLFADATPVADAALMERLCDVRAAELLLPGEDVQRLVQQHGLAPSTIPVLCQCYEASSIAAALQMVHTATTPCYLVIAGPSGAAYRRQGPRLVMQYTAASPEARYTIQRGQPVPADHPITAAWAHAGTVVRTQVPLPFARGHGWAVLCEALAFRRRVFAVFHVGLGERSS